MNVKKVAAVIIITLVVIGGTTGFLVYYFLNKDNVVYPPCVEKPFTSYPVNMTKLSTISPLGGLNPPAHTFPVDHLYFSVNTTDYPDGFEIYSPGNVTITSLSKVEYGSASNISEDITINFQVCEHVSGRFGHMNNLSNFFWNIIEGFGEEYGDSVDTWQVAGENFTAYTKQVTINVLSGQLLGQAGLAGAYDFTLKDERVILNWVNQDWTNEFQHTVCALDYFEDDLKTVLQTKLATWFGVPVFPAGYGGRIDYDVPDTAQGIWVKEDWVDRVEDYGLVLAYDNFNASMGAVSIGYAGNSSWDTDVYLFSPQNSGFRNRNFSHITNDGNVYYYFCNRFFNGMDYTKVILLKMTANREILLQFIDTGGTALPADPTPFFNELNAVKYIR